MSRPTATPLEQEAIDAFLGSQTTGTLSFAKENDSYAIPVGFSYAPESQAFYFRLGYAPGSRKWEYAQATELATFVVAAETESGWTSVVARGELQHINTVDDLTRHSLSDDLSPADHEIRVPFYNVFESPSETLFVLAALKASELTGVEEAND